MVNNNQNFLVGALLGGILGAAAMLLLTPVSGERARKKLINSILPEGKQPKRQTRKNKITRVKTTAHFTIKRKKASPNKHK